MARDTYERGFLAGLEFARIKVHGSYTALDSESVRFKAWLDGVFKAAIAEGEADPDALRRRLMQAWHNRPRTAAQIIDLADVREATKGAA